jgi:hypothetical protein
MSLTSDTVANILQDVADLRGESSVNTDADRIRAVSKAERNIAGRRLFKWLLRQNISLTGDGTNAYTIGDATYPMREKGLTEVFVGGTAESNRYQVVDFTVYKNLYNQNNAARIAYEYFDQANDLYKVHINPAPATGTAIYYSYFYTPPKRTLTTDKVVCPNLEAITTLALAYIYENEDEGDYADTKKQEAEQMISELIALDNMPGVNQLYSMGAIENSTSTHGIGTY